MPPQDVEESKAESGPTNANSNVASTQPEIIPESQEQTQTKAAVIGKKKKAKKKVRINVNFNECESETVKNMKQDQTAAQDHINKP